MQPATEAPDHRRFRAIYRAEFAFVWAVARRFGIPPAALDDAVQDVFLTAYRRLDGLGYQVSPRAWLYAVTRKVASQHRRGAARRARKLAALTAVDHGAPRSPHHEHDAARALDQLLAPLPRTTREVWELTEILGMTGPEIAAELDIPLNTVYSRLRLARTQLLARAPELDGYVAAVKHHDRPPEAAASRNWAVLLPALHPGSFTIATAWIASPAALATTMITAAAAVVLVSRAPSNIPPAASPPPAISTTFTSPPSPAATPTAPPPPPPITTTPPRRVLSPADRLAAEVDLLDRARANLANDPAAALTLLARHPLEFPDGSLHDAREAARVDALCRLGDAAAAESAAHALFKAHDSLLARKYEHYVCHPNP
ncbi:MAG: sigma-70 family RNA polymerase sigma factor [Myxococcales bacterium]|nr:sigma-70 family RNA polymerase sigma factor [Myxococcales bacterium]